jgi:metal-responsive CopG/Arc/MetJ family transcriptional regulator
MRSREPRDVAVTFRTTTAAVAELDRIAAEEQRDRSDVIRILLKEAVAARAKKGTL